MSGREVVGFGIDLAGYTTGKTSFAAVVSNNEAAEVIIFEGSVFSAGKKFSSDNFASEILAAEVETIQRCLKSGKVAVDVPIDLQNLRNSEGAHKLWELTLRPIDKALNALPPLADRIGASVARFQAIANAGKLYNVLGLTLFETYPEGIWKIMGLDSTEYKTIKATQQATEVRRNICQTLGLVSELKTDHEIDAVVSALTANAPSSFIYRDEDFADLFAKKLGPSNRYKPPKGFRLLKKCPYQYVSVRRENFETWLARET